MREAQTVSSTAGLGEWKRGFSPGLYADKQPIVSPSFSLLEGSVCESNGDTINNIIGVFTIAIDVDLHFLLWNF